MPISRRFVQVDVFGAQAYQGNPLAVVLGADGLDAAQMQRFARWTNLSETTFLLPPHDPAADYRVRIFTTARELPFAGHPTLGSCHAWLASGGAPRRSDVTVQECGAGLVPVRRTEEGLAFAAPPLRRSGPVAEAELAGIAGMLNVPRDEIVDAQWVDNGPGWVGVLLPSAQRVLALQPGPVTLDIGVVGPHPSGAPEAYEVRAFMPREGGTAEDPVTGSLNASLAQWLLSTGRAVAPYRTRQGTAVGRSGRVTITRDPDGTVWTGGRTVTCIEGTVLL